MAMFNSYVKLPVGQMKFIDLLRIEDIGSLYDVMRILYIYMYNWVTSGYHIFSLFLPWCSHVYGADRWPSRHPTCPLRAAPCRPQRFWCLALGSQGSMRRETRKRKVLGSMANLGDPYCKFWGRYGKMIGYTNVYLIQHGITYDKIRLQHGCSMVAACCSAKTCEWQLISTKNHC